MFSSLVMSYDWPVGTSDESVVVGAVLASCHDGGTERELLAGPDGA